MMAGNQGFASMSKGRLKETARKGGKNSNKSGTKHEWTKAAAQAAAAKSVQIRLKRLAQAAFTRLVNLGFEPLDIAGLHLTDKELIAYGGTQAKERNRVELKHRIAESKKAK